MKYKLYPWLKNIYKKIISSNIIYKYHFGLIINSSCELGVDILVFNIIKWMFCIYKSNYYSCNKCLNCRLLNKKNHPNFFLFNKLNEININKVREIYSVFNNNLYISNYKIIYFNNFIFDNKFINNFLLKVLEEPCYKLIIIFSCFNNVIIPPTILSRCYKYEICVPKEKFTLNWIIKKLNNKNIWNNKELLTSIRLSNYSPLYSIIFLNKLWKVRCNFLLNIKYFFGNNINKIFLLINNNLLINNIYWLYYILVDILRIKLKHNKYFYNFDSIELLNKLSKKIKYNKIILIINKLIKFLNNINNNLNLNKKILLYKLIYDIYYIINLI